jgi:hypothetical protein
MTLRSTCLVLAVAVTIATPGHAAAKAKPRRNLTPAAIIVGTFAGGTLLAGVLLYSMTPRPFLQPNAYRQYRRDRAGIALMAIGGALVIPTVVLGVLAHRQEREERAARNAAVLSLAPQLGTRGGGAALQLEF